MSNPELRHSESYDEDDRHDLFSKMARGRAIPDSEFRTSIAKPFKRDYSDFISGALEREKSYVATYDGLNIYVLRGNLILPMHGLAECAVLENSEDGSHVVLRGELIKQNLDFLQGIYAFSTKGENPLEEVRALFDQWEKISARIKKRHSNVYRRMDAVREQFKEIAFDSAYQKYLEPVMGPQRGAWVSPPAPLATPEGPTS